MKAMMNTKVKSKTENVWEKLVSNNGDVKKYKTAGHTVLSCVLKKLEENLFSPIF